MRTKTLYIAGCTSDQRFSDTEITYSGISDPIRRPGDHRGHAPRRQVHGVSDRQPIGALGAISDADAAVEQLPGHLGSSNVSVGCVRRSVTLRRINALLPVYFGRLGLWRGLRRRWR